MTLVVPFLKRQGLKWHLEGRATARQALLTSGLVPVLAAPTPSGGESLIEEATLLGVRNGLLRGGDHVVVLSRNAKEEHVIKVGRE